MKPFELKKIKCGQRKEKSFKEILSKLTIASSPESYLNVLIPNIKKILQGSIANYDREKGMVNLEERCSTSDIYDVSSLTYKDKDGCYAYNFKDCPFGMFHIYCTLVSPSLKSVFSVENFNEIRAFNIVSAIEY